MALPLDPSWQQRPLLVFACHEAWVHQLRLLDRPLDIVVGLRGRPAGWDEKMRPVPPRGRLVRLEEALRAAQPYGCIIAHNLSDLLDVKSLPGPRLLVLHETLDGAALEQQLPVPVGQFREAVAQYVHLTGTHVVAVSSLKGRSWGFEDDIVPFSADAGDDAPWQGNLARGLRVSNQILRRPRILLWELHQQAFGGLPVTLVGHNPGLEGVHAAAGWDDLKQIFRAHRFYIHTADPRLEDGYNMATLEAMAAGLPVLGNPHPTSPVEHGVSGFLSDDPAELRGYALRLLEDRALAARLGAAAREFVGQHFSGERFRKGFGRSIEAAQRQWLRSQKLPLPPASRPLSGIPE
jgi:glycosyltransferase involved in cell wall biosynthesis